MDKIINEINFEKWDKVIWAKTGRSTIHITMGIYFSPITDSKTKVEFVTAFGYGPQLLIDQIIEESKYYLENGEEAYRKYTQQKRLEEDAEIEAARDTY